MSSAPPPNPGYSGQDSNPNEAHGSDKKEYPYQDVVPSGDQPEAGPSEAPPEYTRFPEGVGAAGHRIPLVGTAAFPHPKHIGTAPCHDVGGAPIYLGSAILEDGSVHPCKCSPNLQPPCRVPYAGVEMHHSGRFDLLPVTKEMEFVPAANGVIPKGRRPVQGGFETNGQNLYHAVATVQGVRVPGKTGIHLSGANVPFGGREHIIRDGYEILCWRN